MPEWVTHAQVRESRNLNPPIGAPKSVHIPSAHFVRCSAHQLSLMCSLKHALHLTTFGSLYCASLRALLYITVITASSARFACRLHSSLRSLFHSALACYVRLNGRAPFALCVHSLMRLLAMLIVSP